ncbi:hypothetical protein [Larkinella rosea]|uniref:Uncharacterized protein n=1 Tax=Larkinella rosea TaxID=2025312 RepID=A0A3P1BKG0_9BACT|nr:hypothetical protein [Larkinella rosea]RRB01124.1 hypothetical protein EHT25_23405 [Larkinella rosea]
MKTRLLVVGTLVFDALFLAFRPVRAQTPKESTLIAHLVSEARQPDAHSKGDVFLQIKIGKVAYMAELESGKVIDQQPVEVSSGGFCGAYAEVSLNLLDKKKQETAQGAGQILKVSHGKWKRVALSEGDYLCEKLKEIPKSVINCLKVACN